MFFHGRYQKYLWKFWWELYPASSSEFSFHRTRNGSVVTWGHPKYGGDSDSDIVEQLRQLGDQTMMAEWGDDGDVMIQDGAP